MPKPLAQKVVEEWVALCPEKFHTRDIWNELDIGTPEGRTHLRVILSRLTDKGVVRPTSDGGWRKVNGTCKAIDWQSADLSNTVDLLFPFDIEDYATIYPKSIIVVAGTKNAGKTAFLYNFILLNMNNPMGIDLYNSETGPEQMKQRFSSFDIPSPCPFNVYERYDTFSDVINPDRISVIDYLDFNSETYLVGAEIDAMFRKLNKGVVVVALQKPPPAVTYVRGVKKVIDRDLAYGGAFSAKRSVLYISLSENHAKLVYVKTPRNPKINPNNMQWTYSVAEDGVTITNIQRYIEPRTEDEWKRLP